MNRLTHTRDYENEEKNKEDLIAIRNKLFFLENIEEELGIDLITLFKALKNGCWLFSNHCHFTKDEICFLEYRSDVGSKINFEEKYFTIVEIPAQNEFDVHKLYFSDYGKTWALDKKDLTSEELNK